MTSLPRLHLLDAFRGLALIFILLFHSSIYGFARINQIDFAHPPLIVVAMSFMTLWGGIFIVYSSFFQAYTTYRRAQTTSIGTITKYLLLAAIAYLLIHFVLILFVGRWANDFVANQPHMTTVAVLLRTGKLALPDPSKLAEGSSLSTLAVNLLVISLVLHFILQPTRQRHLGISLLGFSLIAITILYYSYFRVNWFPQFEPSIGQTSLGGIFMFSLLLANPYPLLPYLSYGLIGMVMGLAYARNMHRRLYLLTIPAALGLMFFGLHGMGQYEKSLSTPDYFWYYKTHVELGLFLLLFLGFLWLSRFIQIKMPLLSWFSRISLTIYLLETLVSELCRYPMYLILPNWDQTIHGSLIFGLINVGIWIIVVVLWRRIDFKYSLEYFWVTSFTRIGKTSTKLEAMQ